MIKIKKFNELNEEVTITLTAHEKVDVPEKDITDVIDAIKNWFDKNPDKKVCRPSIFGYDIWDVNRDTIEKDVRACAKEAKPYKKV